MNIAAMPSSYRFPKALHLQSEADFERVYSRRCKASDGVLLLFADANTLGQTRLGCSVSRKHGGAVERNRLKRWLREAFRLSLTDLPAGIDLIAIPVDAQRASLPAYQASFLKLARKLSIRLADSGNAPARRS